MKMNVCVGWHEHDEEKCHISHLISISNLLHGKNFKCNFLFLRLYQKNIRHFPTSKELIFCLLKIIFLLISQAVFLACRLLIAMTSVFFWRKNKFTVLKSLFKGENSSYFDKTF